MGYDTDIVLEHRFARSIKSILGMYFFSQNVDYDRTLATDFVIFSIPNREIRVAARLRRYPYFVKYPDQFTIRWSRPSGVSTEIDKIQEGLVDYMIYGFIDELEKKIIKYFIGDIRVFRINSPLPICILDNIPPDSKLAVFNISQLPPEFILHSWDDKRTTHGVVHVDRF